MKPNVTEVDRQERQRQICEAGAHRPRVVAAVGDYLGGGAKRSSSTRKWAKVAKKQRTSFIRVEADKMLNQLYINEFMKNDEKN